MLEAFHFKVHMYRVYKRLNKIKCSQSIKKEIRESLYHAIEIIEWSDCSEMRL